MQELQVVVNQKAGAIEWNYDEIKAALQERMDLYKDAVVTEDGKTMAKKEVAALRNMKKAIDEKRKEVKNKCLEPYDEFNSKVMELMTIIDEPISLIDRQVKAFEEKRKEERRAAIRKIYDDRIGGIRDFLPLERFYNAKWENVATSIKSIKEDIESIVSSTESAIQAISSMQSDAVPKALNMYKQNLDMAAAVAYINNYERQKLEILQAEERRRKEEEERKHQAEIERIRQEERKRIAEEERIREEERKKVLEETSEKKETLEEPEEHPFITSSSVQHEDSVAFSTNDEPDSLPFAQPGTLTVFYKVVATEEELEHVEMAFNSIGIIFERRNASGATGN